MVKRVLVTTAHEATWPENEPVLFLGEWCRLQSRKERWSEMDAEVLPYHWDDRKKLSADYQDLQSFYERVLLEMAAQLNQIHGVEHEVRYWRILIGPWLNCFIHVVFDRWTTVHQAINNYDISGAYILDSTQVPCDMADYTTMAIGDEGNERIYAMILQQFTNVSCTVRESQPKAEAAVDKLHSQKGLMEKLRNAIFRIARVFSCDTDAVIFMAGMSISDVTKLLLRFRQVPQDWQLPPLPRVSTNPDQRQWRLKGEFHSEFEAAVLTLIPQLIPTAYLEGYSSLLNTVKSMPWPKHPKFIYTKTAQYTVEVFKAWAAEKTESGAQFVIGQHGGQYGVGLFVMHEDHETAISDRYLSWGWSKPNDPKVKPVGMLSPVSPMGVNHAVQPHALMVAGGIPRYSFWLRSFPIARQLLDYFDDQCAFVECLPKHIRDALIVRLHPANYGWNLEGHWGDRFDDVTLDSGQLDMNELISQTRVFVTTYNATAFLESFAMDIPSVVYWNPDQWELRDSAIPYFEGLKRVGVFHETPQSAARHLAAIWHDVDAWWGRSEVRDEIARFSQHYGRLSDDLLADIRGELKAVMTTQGDRRDAP